MSTKKSPLEIVRDLGVWSLTSSDGGCICGSFEVGGVTVDMSCHKPQAWNPEYKLSWNGPLIRCYGSDDARDMMEPVALEVARQLIENSYKYSRIGIRYCAGRHDTPPVCTYCENPREDIEGYVCRACYPKPGAYVGETVGQSHDYSKRTHFYGDERMTGMGVACITIEPSK